MVSVLIVGIRVDPWSVWRIAAVIVDPRRRRAACYGREGVEEGEEEAWRKVKREWMGGKEEGMEGGWDGKEEVIGRKGWG